MAVSHVSPLSPTTATFRTSKRPVSTDKPLPQVPRIKQPCEDERCRAPTSTVWHCVDCDSNYCEECWNYQGPHRPGKLGRDGVPHEKTDIQLALRLRDILQPPGSADRLRQLHEEDRVSKWFGMVRDQHDRPTLEDYGRYASLMGSLAPLDGNKDRFPQLVSFIGTTNAGKSTIIKMLINHMPSGVDAPSIFPTPVVGSTLHDKVPTSGDVHLYADQSTHAGQLPLLYADCEGFEGGEKLPLGARPRRRGEDESSEVEAEFAQSRRFPIEWADNDDHSRREFAVTELYPRLLYTFSDVVVFVLRNPKTFQSSVLTKLLQWGASALETSINQPSLPHAIVLLNDSDPAINSREWDTAYATSSLLSCLTEALDDKEGVPLFKQLAQRWRDVGVAIDSIEDLILRYYSTFKVIRMPRKPHYSLINKQIHELHAEIRANCEVSFWSKRRARMLTTSEELNTYLQSAFEHYSRTLTVPFNFVQVSWINNPITYDFGGHLLQLANAIAALEPSLRRDHARSQWIFDEMSILIASCVMLDCARHRKGQIKDLFEKYREFFEWALNEYCDLSLPCSFSSEDGRECQLVKARHAAKGHQDEIGIIGPGDFSSRFNPQQYFVRWEAQLRGAIDAVQQEFQDEHVQVAKGGVHLSDEKIALDLHRQYLGEFYRSVSGTRHVFSHASCFCCLLDVAEYPLPCGHVLCSNCVQAYGHEHGRSIWTLPSCPLHVEDMHWDPPHSIHFKPPGAGIRVLCMDGGGVRGIVQLEVLRSIEQALGGELPIRSFFDLMVGTGTGGIIALALGVQQWSVNHTIDTFGSLCDRAYASRLRAAPLVDLAAAMGYGAKYRTRSFRRALRELFGEDDPLFAGSASLKSAAPIRVAVTATTSTADKAIALTNYRRKEVTSLGHELERPHDPAVELRIHEAAAATSAAPTYFKPFVHPKTHRTYLDGAVLNNNPAHLANEERKLIWPDVENQDPDILLSLGTGQNRISVLPKLSSKQMDKPALRASLQSLVKIRSRALSRLFKQYSKVDDILDAELAWANFRTEVIKPDSVGRNSRRYIRFNPDLDRGAPAMDAKDQLGSLQMTVRKRLTLPHCKTALQHVAHKLIASCFYLEVKSKVVNQDATQHFTGQIFCRFRDETEEMRALGRFLQRTQGEFFNPHLLVRSPNRPDRCQLIDIPHDVIENMVEIATFNMSECTFAVEDVSTPSCINLMLTAYDGLEPDGFPISGFPRVLQNDLAPYIPRTVRPQRSTPDLGSHPASSTTSLERTSSSSEHQTPDTLSPKSPLVVTPKSPRPDLRRLWHASSESLSKWDNGVKRCGSVNQSIEKLNASTSYRDSTKKNRFWTYIGPTHMANFPHLYPPDVLQKFAPSVTQTPVLSEEPVQIELDSDGAIHEAGVASLAELPGIDNAIFELSASQSVRKKSVTNSDPLQVIGEHKVLLNDAEAEAQWLQCIQRKQRARSLSSMSFRPGDDQSLTAPTIRTPIPPSPPRRVVDARALETAIRESFG